MFGQPVHAEEVLEMDFPYNASNLEVSRVYSDISERTGLMISTPDRLTGLVTLHGGDQTLRHALDAASNQTQTLWWFDGAIIHVEPTDSLLTELIPTADLTQVEIEDGLQSFGIDDSRFPIRLVAGASIARVTGPQGYVEQVRLIVEALVSNRPEQRALQGENGDAFVPPIFYGR